MSVAGQAFANVRRQRPEWGPWLHVIGSMQEHDVKSWEDAVPLVAETKSECPVLTGALLTIDADVLRGTYERLVHAARFAEIDAAAGLLRVVESDADLPALFAATVCEDREQMTRILGDGDGEAPYAIVALAALPLLQACGRRHVDAGARWRQPYCPICAAWPAFVEVRGIERDRFARCGRCGSAWHAPLLTCGYCGTSEHDCLVLLTAQAWDARGTIEACAACGRYTKAISTLQGCAPSDVYVNDLASVEFDVAALESGYTRPQGLGCALAITVRTRPGGDRLFPRVSS